MPSDLVTWLARLRELSELAVRGIPTERALALVAATARELMPLDFCGVLTPDGSGSALLITGWDGLSREYVDRINRTNPVGLGSTAPSSRAYYSGEPVVVSDIAAERGFAPWGGVAQEQGYRSMISVPLRSDRGILGTLNGYHSERHHYTDDEIERMTLLANHAAVALSSAGMVDDLRRTNETLLEQRDLLERSQAIREQLLRASLGARGIDAVITALREIVRRPVVYLARADDTAPSIPDPDRAHRHPVFVENELAGELVIPSEPGEELDSLQDVAIGHAAAVLALELLRQRTALDTEHRIAGELLQDVLTGGITEQSRNRAAAMGFDLATLRIATAISVEPAEDDDEALRRQLRRAALTRLGRLRLPAADAPARPLVAEFRGRILALWPDSLAGDPGPEIHACLHDGFPTATSTVASSGPPRATLAAAVRIAVGALAIATTAGAGGRAVRAPELGFVGVLLHVDDPNVIAEFVDSQLGQVIGYDTRRGSDLMGTLRSLVELGNDRVATARALRVHPNTVQQRLRRIESLTGRDLSDPRALLDLTSAMVMLSLAEPQEGSGRPHRP
jgi:GAF domain-containing protein